MKTRTKITCFLCHCLLSVVDGDKSRVDDHMRNEHDVRYDFDCLLVLSVMTQGEKKIFTREFDKKLKERISKSKDFVKPNISKEVLVDDVDVVDDDDDDDDEIISVSDTNVDEAGLNIIGEESNEVSPQKMVVNREGVLKCKFCPRYIKQSQMSKHKEENHKNLIENSREFSGAWHRDRDTENLLRIEENEQEMNVELDQNISPKIISNKKRSISTSSINVDKVSKTTKEDVDPDDEDWSPPSKRKVGLSCRYCSKKFSSKLSVTSHERRVHVHSKRSY